MKMNKILAGLVAVASIFAASSCSDDDSYTPAEPEVGTKVFFSNALPKTIDASSAESSVTVKVSRTSAGDAVTVPLTVSNPDALFQVPTSVAFAAGQTDADLVITYDAEAIGFDKFSTITISVDKSVASLYGISEYTFKIGIPAPWVSMGECTFFEQFMGTLFGVDTPLPYKVEMQKNLINVGLYRLVNPYDGKYPYNETGDWDTSMDYYLEIHAENPDKVYIIPQMQGIDWGYGKCIMGSLAGLYLNRGDEASAEQYYGTLKDGIISFPAKALLFGMADYNDGGLYAGGVGGPLVAMPGVVVEDPVDYSLEITDEGAFQSKAILAEVVNMTLGKDVKTVKYSAVGLITDEEMIAEIADMIDSDSEDLAITTTTESGYKLIPVDDEGDYTLIAVIYDADGNRVGENVVKNFTYKTPGAVETWTPIAVGDYTYNALMPLFGVNPEEYVDELVLYQSDSNPTSYKIADWGLDYQDFTFTKDEDGVVTVGVDILAQSYNSIYCGELGVLVQSTQYGWSSYDEANKTYNFNVGYYIGNSIKNYDIETFVIKESAESRSAVVSAFNRGNTITRQMKDAVVKSNLVSKKSLSIVKK